MGVTSLSARRAWIEMFNARIKFQLHLVALRKESVDRNPINGMSASAVQGRSPQGERG